MPNRNGGVRGSLRQAVEVPRVLVIDSYDSFVYNLVQYLGELELIQSFIEISITVDEALAVGADGVLLSLGLADLRMPASCACDSSFRRKARRVGVCLGHQAIGHVYGAEVVRASELMHGKTSKFLMMAKCSQAYQRR